MSHSSASEERGAAVKNSSLEEKHAVLQQKYTQLMENTHKLKQKVISTHDVVENLRKYQSLAETYKRSAENLTTRCKMACQSATECKKQTTIATRKSEA